MYGKANATQQQFVYLRQEWNFLPLSTMAGILINYMDILCYLWYGFPGSMKRTVDSIYKGIGRLNIEMTTVR